MRLNRYGTTAVHPQMEQELALLLCQPAEVRREKARVIAELSGRVDFERVAEILLRNGVLASCGSRLEEICDGALPASFIAAKERVTDQLRARTVLLEAVTASVLGALEAAGIRALPLKGALLARRIHGDTPVRPASDIDVLVSRRDLGAAREILESRGYGPPSDVAFVDGLPNLHYKLESVHGDRPPVELHWRIHWYEADFSERMLDRSALDDSGIRRAAAADELASLLLFYQRDSFLGLKLVADIAAWWDLHRHELPYAGLTPLLAEHPELRDALLTSAAVVERLVAVPVTSVLAGSPLRPLRAGWAARLGDWSYGDMTPQAIANLSLIDWLLTPKGGQRACARRYLLQPPLTFAREHDLPEEPRARDHFRRSAHGLARFAKAQARLCLALWHIRGGRFWTPLPAALEGRPFLLGSGRKRKKAAHPAVVETCDATSSAHSG